MSRKTVKLPEKSKGSAQKLLSIRAYLLKLVRLEEADARKCAAKIYRVALQLAVDVDEWQAFCEHEDWGNRKRKPQPKPESRKDALQFALQFTFIGLGSNAGWSRKLNDLVKDAWGEKQPSAAIKAHIRAIQEAQRAKAAETRDKRRENAPKTVTLMPTLYSKPLLATDGEHQVKADVKVSIQPGQKPKFEIVGLGKKALKSFGFSKTEKPKPAKKPSAGR